jgi:hypothetical protein
MYRTRGAQSGPGAAPSYLRKSVYALKPIVDKWNGVTATPVAAPTPVSTPPDRKLVEQEQTLRQQHTDLWMSLPDNRRTSLQNGETKFQSVIDNESEIRVRIATFERQADYLKSLGAYEWHEEPAAQQVQAVTSIPIPTPSVNPVATPSPAPTPYGEAAEVWKAREHVVRQEYEEAWMALPETTRLQLHDEELRFQGTIKTFDPPTRMRTLKQRIEHLKTLSPRSALTSRPASPVSINSGAIVQDQLRLAGEQYNKVWASLPDNSRLALREQELSFRNSLKGLDAPTALKQLQRRVLYLKTKAPIQ